jgi:phosphoribosyl 1,2-cyclic phosphodiesterase
VRVRVWGSRGSLAAPGPETVRYGGNTACVEVRSSAGGVLILDAGTGARRLGDALLVEEPERIDLFLSHLHVDHVEGLGAFAPIWSERTDLHIWGPASPMTPLADRIATYFSPPLFPVHLAEVPARVTFHDAPEGEWTIGDVRVSSHPILHPGPTVGYRLEADDRVLTYLTDHEPGLWTELAEVPTDWISGHGLAFGADVLIHDCQFTEEEYRERPGWGHSSTAQFAVFAERAKVERAVLFHHDPSHDDATIERMRTRVLELWDVDGSRCLIAAEGMELDV